MSDNLMDIILEKYDQLTLQGGGKGKTPLGKDAAFGTDVLSKKGKWKGKKFSGNCYNCGWSSHWNSDCWEEGGGKASQAPKGWKPRGKKTKDNKNKNKSSVSMNVTTSEKDSAQPDSAWLTVLDPKSPTTGIIDAFVACNGNLSELYDSGASQHLSLCCEHFLNFISIPPKPIRGADNGTFNAIGHGDLPIYLPNGDT